MKAYLIGNGLSVAYNPDHYSLDSLTPRVTDRLAQMNDSNGSPVLEALEGIRRAISPDGPAGNPRSFEDIAGPIDRAANLFTALGPLTEMVRDPMRQKVLNDIGNDMRGLYRRVVGVVLECVMDHAHSIGDWSVVDAVGQHIAATAVAQDEVDVFVLNYDSLLDAGILNARDNLGTFNLVDEFAGWTTEIPIWTPARDVRQLECHPWRGDPYTPGWPLVRLHHLHGSGKWLTFRGELFKARHLSDMRDSALFTSWAEGIEGDGSPDQVEPVVLLGDQKERFSRRSPFNDTYADFTAAVVSASEIIVAGYGFGDEPLNRVIREYRPNDAIVRVVSVDSSIGQVAELAIAGLSAGEDDWLVVDASGLPDGLG